MQEHQQPTLVMIFFFIATMCATTSSFISLGGLSPITTPILFRMNYGSSYLLNLVQLNRFSQNYFLPHPFYHQFFFHPRTYPTHLATKLPQSPMLPTYPTHPSYLSFHFFKSFSFFSTMATTITTTTKSSTIFVIVATSCSLLKVMYQGEGVRIVMGWRHNVVLLKIVIGWRCEMKVCLLSLCLCLGYCKSICYSMHSREDVFGCFSISCRRRLLSYCICYLGHSFLVLFFQEDDNEPNCHLLVVMFTNDDVKPTMCLHLLSWFYKNQQ